MTHTKWTVMTLALVSVLAAPAAAQVERGDLVYIEDASGALVLHRRIDAPFEGDSRASFVPVPAEERDRVLQVQDQEMIPVVSRSAVVSGGQAAAPVETPPPSAGTAEVLPMPAEEGPDLVRFRAGITGLGGGTLAMYGEGGDPEGWMAGLALRVGIQVSDWFSIYYQPTGILAGLETTPDGGDYDEAFVWWNPVMIETTLFNFLSVAAGPSMDFYFECDPEFQGQASCAEEGAFFGLHGRVAVNIGGLFLGQRGAFSLSAEIHPTWFWDDSETLSIVGGLGVELY